MPTKRTRRPRTRKGLGETPLGVRWWVERGVSITIAEARSLDLGDHAAWQISNLCYDRPTVSSFWTRADLRDAGYGPQIDAHIAAGRCRPDR